MDQDIKVSDVQNYCENCKDGLLVHGTVSSFVGDILKDGLLIRAKDFPTVLSSNAGMIGDGTPITEYTWYEPRGNGESVSLIIQVPAKVLKDIKSKGLPLTQKNIFDVICEDIELEVPDTEETREAYRHFKENKHKSLELENLEGIVGPKFSKYGDEPGTKYTHIGIPSKYICAITSATKVYYVSEQVKKFIKEQANIKNIDIIKDKPLTLYDTDKLF